MEMIQGEYVENVKIMSAEIQNGKLSKKLDPSVIAGEGVSNSDSLKTITKICKYPSQYMSICDNIQLTFLHLFYFCLIIFLLKPIFRGG
jgi:hypothetical protein